MGVQADPHVGGKGPGGGGPDDDGPLVDAQGGLGVGVQIEGHVDGVALLLLVLHLRFRQGGLGGPGPVDRFLPFLQQPLPGHGAEFPVDVRLEAEIHGHVGDVPVGHRPQGLEFVPLDVDEAPGVVPAKFPELGLLHGLFRLPAHLLFHLLLDGQAVAVPARGESDLFTLEVVVLGDDVLEDLVQGMADVGVAVGVGGAVVEGEELRPLPVLLHRFVDAAVEPLFVPNGFVLGQVPPHGESGLGQQQGFFVIHHRSDNPYFN